MTSIEEQAARQDLDNVSRLSFGPASDRRSGILYTSTSASGVSFAPDDGHGHDDQHPQLPSLSRKDSIESNFTSVSQRKTAHTQNLNHSMYSVQQHDLPSDVSNRIALDLLTLAKDSYQQQQQQQDDDGHQSVYTQSQVETNILNSREPIDIDDESDEIEIFGERGIWANKTESIKWRGVLPLSEYPINHDTQPEVITKRSRKNVEYVQELAVRYLRPPTPPAPGEILITQEPNVITPAAPPLIIRQKPVRPITPEPLVIREVPPAAPLPVGRKIITISGKHLPPPPRKVIIERFAQLPAKPQSVLIERWLPYKEVKRRVIFQAAPPDPLVAKPRNVIIQWEAPPIKIKKEFKYLGVVKANPLDYIKTYGTTLRDTSELPSFVHEIKNPEGMTLAADQQHQSQVGIHELEGDLEALKLIDLDKEGLSDYKSFLTRVGIFEPKRYSSASFKYPVHTYTSNTIASSNADGGAVTESMVSDDALSELIEQIFHTIDRHNQGRITIEDAEKTLLRLNSRLGRNYGENDVRAFFGALDANNDETLDLNEFKRAFLSITA